jgi:peptidoglycan/LPS O-acetylase OafA/YrhL
MISISQELDMYTGQTFSMIISINNALAATQIFIGFFCVALLFSIHKREDSGFSNTVTAQLKGFGILAIIFSHIGYFLVNDQRFLFPLSIAAGVGVNVFLLLSGYGLTVSALKKPFSILKFYSHRLPRLYVPFWISIIIFFILDFFVSEKFYGFGYISRAFLGFFNRADLYQDLNSPLWYFSFIIYYYLLFPILFSRKYPVVSAVFLYGAGYALIAWNPDFLSEVIELYQLHILAFPLGVLFATFVTNYTKTSFVVSIKHRAQSLLPEGILRNFLYSLCLVGLVSIVIYTSYHSHVGDAQNLEQRTSIITTFALIFFFIIAKFQNKLFYWFGAYSYEIYLLHWPILSRYNLFFTFFPAWLAVIFYLVFFIVIGWTLQEGGKLITHRRIA